MTKAARMVAVLAALDDKSMRALRFPFAEPRAARASGAHWQRRMGGVRVQGWRRAALLANGGVEHERDYLGAQHAGVH